MQKLTWRDIEEIGLQLFERHRDVDPLTVRFTQLHAWVCELPDFAGDRKESSEKVLEAVQMAWLPRSGKTGGELLLAGRKQLC